MDQVQICLENFSKSFIANNVKSINKIYEEGIYKCVNKYPLQFWPSVHVVSNDINGDAFFILFYKELTVRKQFYELVSQIRSVEQLKEKITIIEELLAETFDINIKMMNYMFENPEKYFLSLPVTYFLDFVFGFVDRFYFFNRHKKYFEKDIYKYDFCLKQMNNLVVFSRILNRKGGVYFRTNEHTFLMGYISLVALCNFHFVTANFGLVAKYLQTIRDIQFVVLTVSLSIPKMVNSVKMYKLFTVCFYMSLFVGIYCQDMEGIEFAINNYVSLSRGSNTFLKFADYFESLIYKNVLFKVVSLVGELKDIFGGNLLKLVDWASFDKIMELVEVKIDKKNFILKNSFIYFLSVKRESRPVNEFIMKNFSDCLENGRRNVEIYNAVFEICENAEVPEEYFFQYSLEVFKNYPQLMTYLTFNNKNSQKNMSNPNCACFRGVQVDEKAGTLTFNGE